MKSSAPDIEFAKTIAQKVAGIAPVTVTRFTTGTSNYVFEAAFPDRLSLVVRASMPTSRVRLEGALFLSELLRSKGLRLPAVLSHNTADVFPWMVLERLEGTDLEHVIHRLNAEQLKSIASEVQVAQELAAQISTDGRFGYAVRPDEALHKSWSAVLQASVDRSRERIASAGLIEPGIADKVQDALTGLKGLTDKVRAVAFLHDTTTKNVIIAPNGTFSGIVDVDDLCFGDSRYPIALTMAALTCYGGPTSYASHWLKIAKGHDDCLFRLYVAIHILGLISDHGHNSNGNMVSGGDALLKSMARALNASLKGASADHGEAVHHQKLARNS
jgi:aminoglycoside phosphotransferase